MVLYRSPNQHTVLKTANVVLIWWELLLLDYWLVRTKTVQFANRYWHWKLQPLQLLHDLLKLQLLNHCTTRPPLSTNAFSPPARFLKLLFQVRSQKGNLEVYVDVNARAEYESKYWTGILDAQGKADGGYYWFFSFIYWLSGLLLCFLFGLIFCRSLHIFAPCLRYQQHVVYGSNGRFVESGTVGVECWA